jgi:transposase
MKRFVQGDNRTQSFLFPEALDDYVTDTNPVRVVDVFVDELDLQKLGFEGAEPALTGRPSYHPEVMLKIYICGYLNRIQSSRRLEREAGSADDAAPQFQGRGSFPECIAGLRAAGPECR